MNLLLLRENDFVDSETAIINDRRFIQLRDVIGLRQNRLYKAGILNGPLGHAELLDFSDSEARLRFSGSQPPPKPIPLSLFVALPRPMSFTKVLHCATSMGVKRIVFFSTFKVEKSYWQSPRLSEKFIENELLLALEQSADTIPPTVELYGNEKNFIESNIEKLSAGTNRLYGDPLGIPIRDDMTTQPTSIAVGPEGGFTDNERRALENRGFKPVSIGQRILRVEFATAALIAKFC